MQYITKILNYSDRDEILDMLKTRDHILEKTKSNWHYIVNTASFFNGNTSEIMGIFVDNKLDGLVRIIYYPDPVQRVDDPNKYDSVVNLTTLSTRKRQDREKYEDGFDVGVTELLNATIAYIENKGYFSHFAVNVNNFRQWKDTPHYIVHHNYETKILETVQAGQAPSGPYKELITKYFFRTAVETMQVRLHSKKKELR